jgi:predicted enzyme related to lactoylglutathione lyase
VKPKNNKINYIEFKAINLEVIKTFYSNCFKWKFTDYGPDYFSFSESGLFGGFEKSNTEITNGVLVVLYHTDLEMIKSKIISEGGNITKEIFLFPGGKRFQFEDPSRNELAVWSK